MKNFENFFSFSKRTGSRSFFRPSVITALLAAFMLSLSIFSVNIAAQGAADLSVAVSDAPDPVQSGGTITYQIVLTNNGPNVAATAVLTTSVPANTTFLSFAPVTEVGFTCTTPAVGETGNITCSARNFANGAALFRFMVNVNPGTPNGTIINESVSTSSSAPDPNASNNSATTTTTVGGANPTPTPTPTPTMSPTPTPTPTPAGGDLSVSNVDAPDPVIAGNNIIYSIILTNNGPSAAANVTLTTTVPANTTFVSISPSVELGFNCSAPAIGGTGNVSCTVPTFNVGAILFKFNVRVNPNTPSGTSILNSVSVSSSTPDPNSLNNIATANTLVSGGTQICLNKTLDFDNDQRADYALIRPSNNFWYVNPSSAPNNLTFTGRPFGDAATDTAVPGDYDGDGKTDLAVWRRTTGVFYVIRSSDNTSIAVQFGQTGDQPVARDYDGDCKTDFAVVRASGGVLTWYILNSGSNNSFRAEQFGSSNDVIAPGDYDGDGKSDLAVFRGTDDNPATFYVKQSRDGFTSRQFGLASDLVVPGDYDGDGKTDFAVVRAGSAYQWYVLRSSDNQLFTRQLGASPDLMTQADYDGDGKTDVSVFRQQTGIFYVIRSSDNGVTQRQFGQNGDYPVANFDTH